MHHTLCGSSKYDEAMTYDIWTGFKTSSVIITEYSGQDDSHQSNNFANNNEHAFISQEPVMARTESITAIENQIEEIRQHTTKLPNVKIVPTFESTVTYNKPAFYFGKPSQSLVNYVFNFGQPSISAQAGVNDGSLMGMNNFSTPIKDQPFNLGVTNSFMTSGHEFESAMGDSMLMAIDTPADSPLTSSIKTDKAVSISVCLLKRFEEDLLQVDENRSDFIASRNTVEKGKKIVVQSQAPTSQTEHPPFSCTQ